MGFGVLTYMTTPLVYAIVLYSGAVGFPQGLLTGIGFGLGRSRPLVTGLSARGRLEPPEVAAKFGRLTRLDRIIGCAAAVAIFTSLIATRVGV
jgi:hypothetical protein